ncbi:MAG: DUF2240 family protein [Euryarchaeota archaeon]|jgi:hypothetical protein|nr:DUF2240 family protein [Euryarchaeota archaeon]MBT6645221.1 DUF2240 family protein [Euryarchaeota archaeon]
MADDPVSLTIRRVLAATWRGDNTPIPSADISRTWCLDLQWFSTDDAESAVTALAESGWFVQCDEGYVPAISTKGITAPLGFCPRIEHLTNPTTFSENTVVSSATAINASPTPSIAPLPITAPPSPSLEADADESSIDPRMKLVPRLIKYVGRKAGLEAIEVERRMERKQLALGPITPWMCLILIAKEQGLPVDDIVVMFQG